MAKIIDPDNLVRSSSLANVGVDGNIWIDTASRTITMAQNGNLTSDGVTIQAFYSYLKEEWKTDSALIKFPFPMVAITPEQFEFIDSWYPADTDTVNLFRDGGFAIKNSNGSSAEEYVGAITLGSIGGSDQVYYQQEADGASSNVVLTGAVNQCIKVYGDGGNHGVDNASASDTRSYFKIFVREYQKLYAQAELNDIGVSTFTYQAYRFPLANSDDLKIAHDDATVSSNLPYTDMDITYLDGNNFYTTDQGSYSVDDVVQDGAGRWYICTGAGTTDATDYNDLSAMAGAGTATFDSYTGERDIGGSWYAFDIIVDADVADDGNLPTAEEIYEYVQYSLRQNADIDAGTGTVTGKTAAPLLKFVGDTLVSSDGVYIDQFSSTDINRIEFFDVSSTKRTYPFVAAGTINFNQNLVDDSGAIYRMFFTDVNGNDFGDTDAILVKDTTGTEIAGNVTGSAVQFTFDYDGNVQGGRTAGTDAPVTVVAIGLDKAQYVKSTGTIAKTNANSLSLVASLERNYSNPA